MTHAAIRAMRPSTAVPRSPPADRFRHRHSRKFLGRQRGHRNIGLHPKPFQPEHAGGHQTDRRPGQPLWRHSHHSRSGHSRANGQECHRRRDQLGVLEGPAPDPNAPATSLCTRPPGQDYTRYLDPNALKGARIGIPRAFFYDKAIPPGAKEARGGLTPEQLDVMNEAIEVLKQQGAIIVDPADIPSIVTTHPNRNFILWNACSGATDSKDRTLAALLFSSTV